MLFFDEKESLLTFLTLWMFCFSVKLLNFAQIFARKDSP